MAKINVIGLLYFLSLWKFPQLSFQGLQVSYNNKYCINYFNLLNTPIFGPFPSYVIVKFFFIITFEN